MTVHVCVLGAECTGKTSLAQALARRLQAQGLAVVAVPEYLRQWCNAQGRCPRAHEQLLIAQAQTQTIAQAAKQAQVVISDTSALQIAVYSELYFNDRSLYDYAAAQQHEVQLTLLMGLDLPWQAGDWQRDGPAVRERADTLLRGALAAFELPYTSVYGLGTARADSAMQAISNAINLIAGYAINTRTSGQFDLKNKANNPSQWVWVCDTCSDPDCEHRLLAMARQAG